MALARRRRFARREDLGLGSREFATLERLATPQKIQAFLNRIPANHELGGETLLSAREVLRQRRAHCLDLCGNLGVVKFGIWRHGYSGAAFCLKD